MGNPVEVIKSPDILLVEDNPDDIFFMKNALKQTSTFDNVFG